MNNDLEGTEFGATFISMQKLMEENADLKLENEKLHEANREQLELLNANIRSVSVGELGSLRKQLEEEKKKNGELRKSRAQDNPVSHVQRLDMSEYDGMISCRDGDWVSYEDFKSLAERFSELQTKEDKLYDKYDKQFTIIQQLQDALSCAEEALQNIEMHGNACKHPKYDHQNRHIRMYDIAREAISKIQSLRGEGEKI